MPAEEEEAIIDLTSSNSSLSVTPLLIPSPPSSEYSSHGSEIETLAHLTPASSVVYHKIVIPLEPNLKDVLKRVTGTDDLSGVTQVKLQVIAVDICLQHISIHIPQLVDLNLDGSVLSSLRDLGCGLKNLKILRVTRCGLTSLDGMFGLQSLEELYAGSNTIEDLSPCSCLPDIKCIDLRKNCIRDISSVTFLSLCTTLEHLVLDENQDVIRIPSYKQIIKGLLPNLKTLDGDDLTNEEELIQKEPTARTAPAAFDETAVASTSSGNHNSATIRCSKFTNVPVPKPYQAIEGSFTVRFSPKVLSPRPSSGSSSDSNITTTYRTHLPHNCTIISSSRNLPATSSSNKHNNTES